MISKIALILVFLWIAGLYVIYLNSLGTVPEIYIVPIFVMLTLTVTVYGFYISYLQWEKNRLETEFLKEQFRLVARFVDEIQGQYNSGFTVVERDGKVLMGSANYFSALSHESLDSVGRELYVVLDFPPEPVSGDLFVETISLYTRNPLFPQSVYRELAELQFDSFFRKTDYAKFWLEDTHVPPSEQFVLTVGSRKKSRDKKPLRIRYKGGYLRVGDLIDTYERFDKALNQWFIDNQISKSVLPSSKNS